MTNIPQHGRGFMPISRTTIAGGISVIVFLVGSLVGLYLSNADKGKSHNSTTTLATDSLATATTSLTVPNSPPFQTPLGRHWTLVTQASTDFVGASVDKSTWEVYDSKGNGGVGWRRPSAITIDNNALRIMAQGDVSGGLAQRFSQTYGRWVVRAKMEKGSGYGPALLLWPDSEKWPQDGEIDFLELPKGDRSEALLTTHWGSDNSQQSHSVPGDYSQWHTYTIDWLPDHLVYYIDGVEQWRVTDAKAIPTKPMHLALQNDIGACNDGWIGCRDANTPDTVSLWVSSVRVYSPS